MSNAIIESDGTNVSITCIRGGTAVTKAKMKSIVKDRVGNEYYCMYGKDDFKIFPDMRPVDVYTMDTLTLKKFVNKYLTWKEEIQSKPKKTD